jgi:arabinofuranosyltransferase
LTSTDQPTPTFPAARVTLLLALAGLIFILHAGYFWPWAEDDAFITFRYASNLVQGEGLVFNPGERVEGYSNPLWVLLAALAMKLGFDPLVIARLVGIAGGLACLWGSWRLTLKLRPDSGAAATAAPLFLALTPMLPRHAVTGLETVPYAALLAAALLLVTDQPRRRASILLPSCLVAVSLLRPEGFVFAGLILAWRFMEEPRSRRIRFEALGTLLFLGAFLVWRWSYYGALLPNTYQAKMTGELGALVDGVHYTLDFLREFGGPVVVGLYLTNLLGREVPKLFWLVTGLIALQVGIVVAAGGDWMHFYRFFVPVLPLMAAGLAAGFAVLLHLGRPHAPLPGFILGAVLLVAFIGSYKVERATSRLVVPAVREGTYLTDGYREAARWIVDHTDEGASVAVSDIGIVGYVTGRPIVDMFGLIDPHIARAPGRQHFKSDADYVLGRDPDVVLLVADSESGFLRIPDVAMAAHPDFVARYALVHKVAIGFRDEVIQIHLRK